VPPDAAEASSSTLTCAAPIVLPPSTVPLKIAPGSTITRFVTPAASWTAALDPSISPALTTVTPLFAA
jgi:hypothetical protein